MQQIFGGTTYSASNSLYERNRQTLFVAAQQQVMDPPSYTKVLSATSLQADPPPSFSAEDPALSGGAPAHPAPYNASDIDSNTLLPPAFLVDWHKVSPLITVPELKQYTKFLGSLVKLLRHALQGESASENGERASNLFSRASREFEAWAGATRSSSNNGRVTMTNPERLPSLEVLMAWHAYMMCPRWYFEDCTRLGKLGPFPLELVAEFIDDETFDYLPPFHSLEPIEAPHALDQPLNVACVTKFAQDLIAVAKGDMHFLAGAGLLPSTGAWKGEDGAKLSQAFVAAILGDDRASFLARPDPVADLCVQLEREVANAFANPILEDVRARCRKGMNIENSQIDARIARMKSAYSQGGSTSLDLGKEMSKQAQFVVKMDSLGWLKPGRFDGDVGRLFPLQKAAIRYHAFLHCISQMQQELACPTLDIELSWQLHQLKSDRYFNDCERLFKGRLLDQSGLVNRDAALHAAYTPTAKAWTTLYQIPYSTCGCYTVTQAHDTQQKPLTLKEKLKAKMSAKTNDDPIRLSAQAFISGIDVNEREASHPSSLDFHHRA